MTWPARFPLQLSRPRRTPHQTPPGTIALIRVLREQHGLPAWAIGRALRVPRSTVGAWLRRLWQGKPRATAAAPAQAGSGQPAAGGRPAPAEASAE